MAPVCTSSEINLLIYHYLKESGFTHSCFSLRHEGRLDEDPLSKQAIIEPGRLIRVLQKGLLYLAVETHVNPDGTEKACSAPFTLVGAPHVCDGIAKAPFEQPGRPASLTPEPEPSASKPPLRDAAAQTTPVEVNAIASSSKDKLPNPASNGTREASTSAAPGVSSSSSSAAVAGKRKDPESPPASEAPAGRSEKRARRDDAEHVGNGGEDNASEADTSAEVTSKESKTARKESTVSRDRTGTPEAESSALNSKRKKKQIGSDGPKNSKTSGKSHSSAMPVPSKVKDPGVLRYPKQDEDGKHFESKHIQFLYGHSGEVFVSAWNPTVPDLVASGAGDASVRIWDLGSGSDRPKGDGSTDGSDPTAEALITKTVCRHLPATHAKDVSALDWNPDGTLLASGSYDGILRLWTPQGDLHLVMSMHQGPIFSVRWNRKGTQLLTGSADSTAIVWDLSSGKVRQQYALHSDSVLDVDWLSAPKASTSKDAFTKTVSSSTLAQQDVIFATCSADNSINLLKLGEAKPLRMFKGHTDEVNAIAFDNSRTLLASASDDMTAKIWCLDPAMVGPGASRRSASPSVSRKRPSPDAAGQGGNDSRKLNAMDVDSADDSARPASAGATGRGGSTDQPSSEPDPFVQTSKSSKGLRFTLSGHTRELYALAWCPSGPGTANDSQPRMLATSAFDHTARLWNADDGSCLRVISDHTDSVYSLAFSPDAKFLVTGGIDALVLVTRLRDGSIAKHFKASGSVLDVQWHSEASGSTKPNGVVSPVKRENADDSEQSLPNGKRSSTSSSSTSGAKLSLAQQNKILTVLSLDGLQ